MRFLVRLVATAAALWLAVQLVPGIVWTGGALGLLGVALVFGVLNALVRPVLAFLSCPLIILTLGLFLLVLNAVMLLLTAAVSNTLGLGFRVEGFIPAFLGGLVVAVASAVLSVFVPDGPRRRDG
jgi:putative membrane protein